MACCFGCTHGAYFELYIIAVFARKPAIEQHLIIAGHG